MSIKCKICNVHIPETEIYGDWYYCDHCKKSIPVTLDPIIFEEKQKELKKASLEIVAESVFDEE